jgi:hypothetical protein
MSDEPKYVAETLAWCNRRRRERGMEPLVRLPKGRRLSTESCPCGSATGLCVSVCTYWPTREKKFGTVPKPVGRFVTAFDAGLLPQYDEELA